MIYTHLVPWGLLGLAGYFSQLVQLAKNIVPDEDSNWRIFFDISSPFQHLLHILTQFGPHHRNHPENVSVILNSIPIST